jgi:radical SAM superfamily enzyme YgiQ (UPF0313 family)
MTSACFQWPAVCSVIVVSIDSTFCDSLVGRPPEINYARSYVLEVSPTVDNATGSTCGLLIDRGRKPAYHNKENILDRSRLLEWFKSAGHWFYGNSFSNGLHHGASSAVRSLGVVAMKVLLLYPEFPETFWSLRHALHFIRKRAVTPPLGLLTMAAMLPSQWNKRLIDLNVRALSADDLAWAEVVMISGMVVQRESAKALIARCKAAGLKVIAGGPLFTTEHEIFDQVDHFVLGEAELSVPPFLADWQQGKAQRFYRADGFADLHTTPVPLWELADLQRYACAGIQFSRGCPFDCDFCNVTVMHGRRPRTKTAAQIRAELEALYRSGWRGGVFFVDDNLIGNRRELKHELLPMLVQWQKECGPFTFNTQVSINLADDEDLMRSMVLAGFDTVFIGIETPDNSGLAECSKSQNRNRDLVTDVQRMHRAGLQVQGGFIVGFDSDQPNIFQRQIDFIQKSGIMTAMVGRLQAIPGTRLYDRMKQAHRLVGTATGDNVDGTSNIVPTMDPQVLQQGYEAILKSIYSPKQYYRRLRTFLKEYHAPPVHTRLTFGRVLAGAMATWRLGFVGKERFHYWRMLLWTSLHRPRNVPLAIQLVICGYHYRRISERLVPGGLKS